MNKIEQLIQQYCPEGVEFTSLKNEFKVTIGEFVHKEKQSDNSKYPVFNGGISPTGYYDEYNNTGSKIIISARGANAGFVNRIETEYWAGNSCYSLGVIDETRVNYNFIFYYLKDNQSKFIEQQQKGGIPAVSKKQVEEFFIPIPPLAIQQEIATILDKFTALEARSRQYEYYRNQLLSFEDKEVQWKALGDVGEFIRGNGLQKKDFTETGVGCIHYGQIYTHYGIHATNTKSFVSEELAKKLKKARKNDLVIAGVSENVEDVCKAVVWLGEEDVCISGDAFIFRHNQNPKFIGYLLQTSRFLEYKKSNAQGAKVTRLRSGSLPKYRIPVPSLQEQEHIVNILDQFDALVNDIKTGLPAEIKARRAQYEYYRKKLLT